jgi:hypothetical protein
MTDPNIDYEADSDERWIAAVLQGLDQRSDKARKALVKAMTDGQPQRTPAGLTTCRKVAENVGKPSLNRSESSVVPTQCLHSGDQSFDARPQESSGSALSSLK